MTPEEQRLGDAVRDWLDRLVGPSSGTVPVMSVRRAELVAALTEGRFHERECEMQRPGAAPTGEIRVWLRPEMRRVTTFALHELAEASFVDDPSPRSVETTDAYFYPWASSGWDRIIEARCQLDVRLRDVAMVEFPTDPGNVLLDRLDAAGVTWAIEEAAATSFAPDPPTVEEPTRTAAAAAVAGLAMTGAAAAPLLVGTAAAKAGADTATAGTAMVLNALAQAAKADHTAEIIAATARTQQPELEPDDIDQVITFEQANQAEFVRKMHDRVARDMPKALKLEDAGQRRAAVNKIVERERRFIRMRQEAMNARLRGAGDMARVRKSSPEGAYWALSDSVKQHTPDCVAMAGKLWPWSVLRLYHPPLHTGCPCRLIPVAEAVRRGLVHSAKVPDAMDAMRRAREIAKKAARLEEIARPGEVETHLALVESVRRHAARFAKGTVKGGEFRPTRGGYAKAVRGEAGRLLSDLVPASTTPRGRTVRLRGHKVLVPEDREFRRKIDGYEFTSPAGSMHLYRDGAPVEDDDVGDWREPGKVAVGPPTKAAAEISVVHDVLAGLKRRDELVGMDFESLEAGLAANGFKQDPLIPGLVEQRTWRHTDSSEVTFLVSADGRVEKAVIQRQKVPTMDDFKRQQHVPGNFEEFSQDAYAFVGQIAARIGAPYSKAQFRLDDSMVDHNGSHTWDGDITLSPRVKGDVEDALDRVARGEADPFPAATYAAYHVVVHELLHGLNPINWRHYGGAGVGMEEALTEELSHSVAQELLIEHGLADVAQWAANNPTNHAVRGVYPHYRWSLEMILNEGKVPMADRPSLLWAMKASMDTLARGAELESLSGIGIGDVAAMMQQTELADANYLGMIVAAPGGDVRPRVFKFGEHRVDRGALLLLRGGGSTKVIEVGEMQGVTFARTDTAGLITLGDVSGVIEPTGGYGPNDQRYHLNWEGSKAGQTVGIGDTIDFGDGTVGEVEDVLQQNRRATAIRVRGVNGSMWVTRHRAFGPISIQGNDPVEGTSAIPAVIEPERGPQGTWQDAGFASEEEAGGEVALLAASPHLARMRDADLAARSDSIARLRSRGEEASVDHDRAVLTREQALIWRIQDAREKAAEIIRRREAQMQRAVDGWLSITQEEFDYALGHTGPLGSPLPDGTTMEPDLLYDEVRSSDGSVRLGGPSLSDPNAPPPSMYRSDLLSLSERTQAMEAWGQSKVAAAAKRDEERKAKAAVRDRVSAALKAERERMPGGVAQMDRGPEKPFKVLNADSIEVGAYDSYEMAERAARDMAREGHAEMHDGYGVEHPETGEWVMFYSTDREDFEPRVERSGASFDVPSVRAGNRLPEQVEVGDSVYWTVTDHNGDEIPRGGVVMTVFGDGESRSVAVKDFPNGEGDVEVRVSDLKSVVR